MTVTDWKHPDLSWRLHEAERSVAAHADTLDADELRMDGLTLICLRTGADNREYAVCVRGDRYWLARMRSPAEYDGYRAMVEVVPTDVAYHDDSEVVQP